MEATTVLRVVTSKYRHDLYAKRFKLLEQGIPCGSVRPVMRDGRIAGYSFKHWHSGPKVNLR